MRVRVIAGRDAWSSMDTAGDAAGDATRQGARETPGGTGGDGTSD